MDLNKKDIERQDFVDNEIFKLIAKLNPTKENIDWNIENISKVRESVKEIFITDMKLCSEFDFYPFMQE